VVKTEHKADGAHISILCAILVLLSAMLNYTPSGRLKETNLLAASFFLQIASANA
jgi:hypothetical protein